MRRPHHHGVAVLRLITHFDFLPRLKAGEESEVSDKKGSQEIRGASTGYSGRVWQQTRRPPRDLLGDPSNFIIAIFLDPAYSLTKVCGG